MDGLSVLLLLVGGVGLYYWNLNRSAGNLNYFPGNVLNFSLTGISPVATVELIVQNPTNIDFTINSVVANATADSTLVGNVSDFTPVTIPANSQASVPLTVTLFSLGIVNQIISAFQGGSISKTILLQGTVNANGYQKQLMLTYNVGL